MNISYSKKQRPPYINFRMRKLINAFIKDNAVLLYSMDANEKAQFIADEVEKIVTANYWIKDKRKDAKQTTFIQLNTKVA